MTKKEQAIFRKIYDREVNEYMRCVASGQSVPASITISACLMFELNRLLFSDECSEDGV